MVGFAVSLDSTMTPQYGQSLVVGTGGNDKLLFTVADLARGISHVESAYKARKAFCEAVLALFVGADRRPVVSDPSSMASDSSGTLMGADGRLLGSNPSSIASGSSGTLIGADGKLDGSDPSSMASGSGGTVVVADGRLVGSNPSSMTAGSSGTLEARCSAEVLSGISGS